MMNKRDWKEFNVRDIFEVQSTKTTKKGEWKPGETNYVSGTTLNNGVEFKVDASNYDDVKPKNTISVNSLGANCAFYQAEPWVGSGHGIVQCLINENLNEWNSLFICTIISKIGSKYSFGKGLFLKKLMNEKITLPIDQNGNPDWKYMEESVRQLEESVRQLEESVRQELCKAIPKLHKISTSNWKEFKIGKKFGGIFDWKIGNISKISTEEGEYPLISCSAINNGVIGTTNKANFENCISVSTNGSCGKCFYQKGRFGASVDTLMLFHNKLNENNALFICTVIEKQLMGKYGYNNKNKGDKTLNESILLPADSFGQPDWNFMEEYMKPINKK